MNYSKDYLKQQMKGIEKFHDAEVVKLFAIQKNPSAYDDINIMTSYFIEGNKNLLAVYDKTHNYFKAPKFELNSKQTKRFLKIANISLKLAVLLFKKHRVSI